MWLKIALHEFRYLIGSLQTLVVGSLFFGLAFLFSANGIEFQMTAAGGNVLVNSPYVITSFLVLSSILAVFIAPAYMATAVLKDCQCRFDGVLYTTPMTRSGYFLGRFGGAFAAFLVVVAAAPIGMCLGTFWPWVVPETLGPNHITDYGYVYFLFVVPSLFTVSTVVFAMAITSRSMIYSYLAALGLLVLYVTVASSKTVMPIWDPFMFEIVSLETRYWTALERNSNLLGYSGRVLANRLLWLGIGLAAMGLAYARFSFRAAVKRVSLTTPKFDKGPKEFNVIPCVQAKPEWSKITVVKQLMVRTRFEILSVFNSLPFILLMGLCMFLLFFALTGRETLYGVNSYPLTRVLLGAIAKSLTFALMAVLAFYSADVIWRERSHRINEIVDALPVANGVFVVSKITALILVMLAIVLLGIVIAMSLQSISGYRDFQLGLYLSRGLTFYPLPYIFLAVLTCFFQVLGKNRELGVLCFVVFVALLVLSRDIFGVEHMLLSYGLPGIAAPLSEMNANSRFAVAGYWARLYWGSMAGLLLMLTYGLWNRGALQPLRYRMRNLRIIKSKGFAYPALALVATLLGSGATIYYNTNILNKYRTKKDVEQIQLAYEQKYRGYKSLPMPRIIDVVMDVDIYPYRRRIETRSTHVLQNKTNQAIHTVHFTFPFNALVQRVELEGASSKSADVELSYYIFNLTAPMRPGETRTLEFETVIQQRGFPNSEQDTRLVRNGTFVRNTRLAPYIGFCDSIMIEDERTRHQYQLESLPRVPKLEDVRHHGENAIRQDSDFITFESTVSTVVGQTAISPGYLQAQWQAGDRHYFSYKMDQPMVNSYGFLSGDYEVTRDLWNDVAIEVLYHPAHHFNVNRMIDGVKDSLDYYSAAFGPYQYRQMRIIEFPAYSEFAQAFPNTIPFSEGIGFVADVRDPREFDLPYFVTAHEMAHQWWAHQVMAAHVQGSTMLLETLAQYSALMVMEQRYGPHQIRRFLKMELDSYLQGRTSEPVAELPLFRVEDQSYIHYRKGAVVMYALKDYIGEEVVNRALRQLLKNHAYESDPYAVSSDLIGYLKAEAGSHYDSLIEDFFERITLFDIKLQDARVTEQSDGRFRVSLDVEVAKYVVDGEGHEREVPFDLPVDIGLFAQHPGHEAYSQSDVIMLEKRTINQPHATIDMVVDRMPKLAGIDPYHKLIDKEIDDNIGAVRVEKDQ